MDKLTLRKHFAQQRKILSQTQRKNAQDIINHRVIHSTLWQKASYIASYHAIFPEVDLSSMHQIAWQNEKYMFLPTLFESILKFYPYQSNSSLKKNIYGIEEPEITAESCVSLQNLSLIIIPAVAVDSEGNRLGRGKAYYDKTLASLLSLPSRPSLMAVTFACQYTQKLPTDPHDIKVDQLITETGHYIFNRSKS